MLDIEGSGYYDDIIAGIDRAVVDGAQVISMSLGGPSSNQALYDACFAAKDAGVVVVCSAGNEGNSRIRDTIGYPARYDCVIAVGATDVNDKLARFSSTGPEIDVVAPGVNILSDYKDVTPNDGLNQDTWTMSGTSMACPHVAGTAALMLKANPSLTPDEVQSILQETAIDKGTTGFDTYYGWGRIDAAAAVAASIPAIPPEPDYIAPEQVQNLRAEATSDTEITLTWTPNTEPDLQGYYIYRSTDGTNYGAEPIAPSSISSYSDTGLQASTQYYYKVSAFDLSNNEGDLSNSATATTQASPPPAPGDFALSASPPVLNIKRGSTGTTTITVIPQNDYSGTVTFSALSSPSDLDLSFDPSSVTSSGTTILTIDPGSARGTYTVTITGTDDIVSSLTHSIDITVRVK